LYTSRIAMWLFDGHFSRAGDGADDRSPFDGCGGFASQQALTRDLFCSRFVLIEADNGSVCLFNISVAQ
jgi:hypothetical protein